MVVYEILPPRKKDGTLNSYAENISSLLSQTHIDAINIPEVRDEIGRGERPVKNKLRAEPREFGKLLQDIVGIESIVNRVVVHQTLKKEMIWFEETYNKYEIENLITVGGESRNITYPGPSVNKALEAIKQNEKLVTSNADRNPTTNCAAEPALQKTKRHTSCREQCSE